MSLRIGSSRVEWQAAACRDRRCPDRDDRPLRRGRVVKGGAVPHHRRGLTLGIRTGERHAHPRTRCRRHRWFFAAACAGGPTSPSGAGTGRARSGERRPALRESAGRCRPRGTVRHCRCTCPGSRAGPSHGGADCKAYYLDSALDAIAPAVGGGAVLRSSTDCAPTTFRRSLRGRQGPGGPLLHQRDQGCGWRGGASGDRIDHLRRARR